MTVATKYFFPVALEEENGGMDLLLFFWRAAPQLLCCGRGISESGAEALPKGRVEFIIVLHSSRHKDR